MIHPITQYRLEQNSLAIVIRETKENRKGANHEAQCKAARLGKQFRLRHIAYCEVRGRTREQIEQHKTSLLSVKDEAVITLHKQQLNRLIKDHDEKWEHERQIREGVTASAAAS